MYRIMAGAIFSLAVLRGLPLAAGEEPELLELAPSRGRIGQDVTVTGLHFAEEPGQNLVSFNGVLSPVDSVGRRALARGDVNLDGRQDILDAHLIARAEAGLEAFAPLQQFVADIDEDGKLSILDAFGVALHEAGLRDLTNLIAETLDTSVPDGATTGPVTVTVQGRTSDGLEFEVLPPSGGAFVAVEAAMSTPRFFQTQTLLDDGTVLLTGGLLSAKAELPVPTSLCERFLPASQEFRPVQSLSLARAMHSAVRLPNGEVIVIGGTIFTAVEVYDPTERTFSRRGALNVPRFGATATLLGPGVTSCRLHVD